MAGKARTANFGLRGVFEREFWTNTPGEVTMLLTPRTVLALSKPRYFECIAIEGLFLFSSCHTLCSQLALVWDTQKPQ